MGNGLGVLIQEEELQDYLDLTYLTRGEIYSAVFRFRSYVHSSDGDAGCPSDGDTGWTTTSRYLFKDVCKVPELEVNPFSDRLCKVFSSKKDDMLSFEDYLDMLSVLSPRAPLQTKAMYAFRVFDFDEDEMLSREDLSNLINRLIGGNELEPYTVDNVVDKILKESDLDQDGVVSYPEFEHIIKKSPDFISSFTIRL